MNAIVKTTC